jgi:two-component system, LytTR family, sensor kinase
MQFRKFFNIKYQFHYLLWVFFLGSLISDVYPLYSQSPSRFFIYVFSKTAVIVGLVYINLGIFHPLLFKKKKYFLFTLTALLLCGTVGAVNTFLEQYMTPSLIGRWLEVFWGQLTMALRYLLIAFLLQITVDYYRQKEMIKKIELEKINAELNFLKAQVNPHFLFNTLNNLYALILEKSDKSAEVVLKLADIMKYILSEGKEDKVALEKEITLIRNYTELERLRKTDACIRFDVTGRVNGQQVTPLLLLPLIENAFKYGLNTVSKNGFITILMNVDDNKLYFTIENNNPPDSNKEALQSLGIGIGNVKKRLNFLYPGKYDMKIAEDSEFFKVALQLNLK